MKVLFARDQKEFRAQANDAYLKVGKTYKAMASELRRSAEADRSGSGMKPLPGRAHGEPNEWSYKEAKRQEDMADWLDSKAREPGASKYVTEADVSEILGRFKR